MINLENSETIKNKEGGRQGYRFKFGSISHIHPLWFVLGLTVLNVALVAPLFKGGYTPSMGSIEPAFLALERFISENFPHIEWNRLWYFGFPFFLFYTPALHFAVAGIHNLLGSSITSTYRVLTAIFYVCTPASFFLLVRYLTRRNFPAVIASLAYSLMPSFCYLIPAVRTEGGIIYFGYAPWQLIVFLAYGEGPHITSLAFAPLAVIGMIHALRNPSFKNNILAALGISSVALINWVGLFGLVISLVVIVASELLLGNFLEKLKTTLLIIGIVYGLCAFWYNYSFIRAGLGFGVGFGGGGLTKTISNHWWIFIVAILVACAISIRFFLNRPQRQILFIALGWLLPFGGIIFGWYLMGIVLAPEPNRYMPEMNLAAAFIFGLLASWVYDKLQEIRKDMVLSYGFCFILLIGMGITSLPYLQVAQKITQPIKDITKTSEYLVAKWLENNTLSDEVVFLSGSHSLWLNAFTNVPQLRGGVDFASINPWWDQVKYQMVAGDRGQTSVLLAKAFGIKYIVVSSPGSADHYNDFSFPQKFSGLLQKVYDHEGMAIYQVPLKNARLLLRINLKDYAQLPAIRGAADEQSLSQYIDLLDRSVIISNYKFVNSGRLEFTADLDNSDEAILLRMTYHAGWQAYCNGSPVPIRQDQLGFMLIEPGVKGQCSFVLVHRLLLDQWLGVGLTSLTIVAICIAFLRARSR